jgi:Uma2 family endonuclease
MKPEKQARHYTVEDYHSWPDDIRCELIDGVIYDMSPAPVIEHQRLSHTLAVELSVLLRAEKNRVMVVVVVVASCSPRPST